MDAPEGIRFCNHCGLPLPADAPACISCGTPRTVSSQDRAAALLAQGFHTLAADDPYGWCRNCSTPMCERRTSRANERICPACGFSIKAEVCTLLSCSSGAPGVDSYGQPVRTCTVVLQPTSMEAAELKCQLYGTAAVPAQPGEELLVYYTCGSLSGFAAADGSGLIPATPM